MTGLGELLRIGEQRSSLWVEIVGPPRRRELLGQVLITRETAHGRRVEGQSRRSAGVTVDNDGDHLPLYPTER